MHSDVIVYDNDLDFGCSIEVSMYDGMNAGPSSMESFALSWGAAHAASLPGLG